MIQRIQTVYLFLSFLVSGALSLFLPLWTDNNGNPFVAGMSTTYTIFFATSAAMSMYSILQYKKRKNSICHQQIEHDIELYFTRIICVSISKFIRRRASF